MLCSARGRGGGTRGLSGFEALRASSPCGLRAIAGFEHLRLRALRASSPAGFEPLRASSPRGLRALAGFEAFGLRGLRGSGPSPTNTEKPHQKPHQEKAPPKSPTKIPLQKGPTKIYEKAPLRHRERAVLDCATFWKRGNDRYSSKLRSAPSGRASDAAANSGKKQSESGPWQHLRANAINDVRRRNVMVVDGRDA